MQHTCKRRRAGQYKENDTLPETEKKGRDRGKREERKTRWEAAANTTTAGHEKRPQQRMATETREKTKQQINPCRTEKQMSIRHSVSGRKREILCTGFDSVLVWAGKRAQDMTCRNRPHTRIRERQSERQREADQQTTSRQKERREKRQTTNEIVHANEGWECVSA